MRRVLRPGGRLMLRVPHAGAFAFLDPNNIRFRMPRLFRALGGRRALRDQGYESWRYGVVWHHHFTERELIGLLGHGWELHAIRRGGLLLVPIVGSLCWPFYRAEAFNNPAFRALRKLADFDLGHDFGRASYDMLMVLHRSASP